MTFDLNSNAIISFICNFKKMANTFESKQANGQFFTWNLNKNIVQKILSSTVFFDLRRCFKDLWQGRIPIWTNLKLARDEHRPTSDIFKHDHLTNDYVSACANRFNLTISEATNETLRAVTLQVALSIFLDYVTDLFTHTVTSAFHTFTNQEKATGTCSSQEAADSSGHQIWISTFLGVVSLTFAQYNQYMIRHSHLS